MGLCLAERREGGAGGSLSKLTATTLKCPQMDSLITRHLLRVVMRDMPEGVGQLAAQYPAN